MIRARVHDLVDRHFAGETSPRADRRMFRHLRRCERCRTQYRVHALLEERAGAPGARDRLARGLFPAPRPARFRLSLAAAALAAAAAAVLLAPRPPGGIQARGGAHEATAAPALTIYRVPPGGSAERVGAVIDLEDALAFSYVNPGATPHRFLMVFAYDGARRVYWFWPAWQDGALDPPAIPIGAASAPVELGEAIRHPLRPGPLTVVALFGDRPLTVRAVEAAVAAGDEALARLGGGIWTERLEVLP